MIDLRRKYIRVKTKYEYEDIMKHAEKQGFKVTKKYPNIIFPTVVHFWNDYDVTDNASHISENLIIDYSELKPEMTAREFVEWFTDTALAYCSSNNGKCSNCKLSGCNTKCGKALCITCNWKDHIDELFEIATLDVNIPPEEKAIENIEELIKDPDNTRMSNELIESLKLAVEKLKG